MYGLEILQLYRGNKYTSLTVVLKKSGSTGLDGCTLNFEKIVKTFLTLMQNMWRTIKAIRNLMRFLEISTFLPKHVKGLKYAF